MKDVLVFDASQWHIGQVVKVDVQNEECSIRHSLKSSNADSAYDGIEKTLIVTVSPIPSTEIVGKHPQIRTFCHQREPRLAHLALMGILTHHLQL